MPSVQVNTSTDGAQLVAAPGKGQFIRVIGGSLTTPAGSLSTVSLKSNGNIKWQSAALAGTAGSGISENVTAERTIDGEPGASLTIGLSSGVQVVGTLEYVILGSPLIGNNTAPGFGG